MWIVCPVPGKGARIMALITSAHKASNGILVNQLGLDKAVNTKKQEEKQCLTT